MLTSLFYLAQCCDVDEVRAVGLPEESLSTLCVTPFLGTLQWTPVDAP